MPEENDSGEALLRAVASAPARPPPAPGLKAGDRLGEFRLIDELGAGGMGVVYRAEDERLKREVALKVIGAALHHDSTTRRRFLREARAAAAVSHPNVATVFEVGEHEGRIFIAMELVSGTTLRKLLRERRLSIEESVAIARSIAAALAKAHEKGIVHRDLKPENVVVGEMVKVLDFGLARPERPQPSELASTSPEDVAGTPAYMSPEQAMGRPTDVRSDVYAFGVVLYEMLAGERPFAGSSTIAIGIATARDPHTPLREKRSEVSHELERIVDHCLAKDPVDRFASAAHIREALESLGARDAHAGTPRRTDWSLLILALAGLAAVLALAGVWARRARPPQPPAPATPVVTATPAEGMQRWGATAPQPSSSETTRAAMTIATASATAAAPASRTAPATRPSGSPKSVRDPLVDQY